MTDVQLVNLRGMVGDSGFEILACPVCKGYLDFKKESQLSCINCNSTYRVKNDIPVLIPDLNKTSLKSKKLYLASLKISYHLSELEIARNPSSKYYILPEFKEKHKTILDIGCGIGQTFIATNINANSKRNLIGIDTDFRALKYGKKSFSNIQFINGLADYLPVKTNSVDFVICRVSLPYTDIRVAFNEIERVLKPGGEFWATIYPVNMVFKDLFKAIFKFDIKAVIYRLYVILNGFLLHCFGKLFYLPGSTQIESFQTKRAMKRILRNSNFTNISFKRDLHFLVTGEKKKES